MHHLIRRQTMNDNQQHSRSASRRDVLIGGAGPVIAAAASTAIAPSVAHAQSAPPGSPRSARPRNSSASHVTTKGGVQIYSQDWGDPLAQPIVFQSANRRERAP